MDMSDDKRTLNISINKSFTGSEIETLISDLAVFRANMMPPIPDELPDFKNADPSERTLIQDEPPVQAKLLNDGRIRFWLKSLGLGWLAFNFTTQQSVTLRDFFIANTPDSDTDVSLFSEDENGGQSH